MAGSLRLTWSPSPQAGIGAPLMARVATIPPMVMALASSHAARAEGAMKAGAPWNDITGFARGSLYGRAAGTDIHIGTANDEYGLYLELGTSRMAARPIIVPVFQQTADAYFRDVIVLVQGALGG